MFALVIILAITDVVFPLLHKYAIDSYVATNNANPDMAVFIALYIGFIVITGVTVYFFIYMVFPL